MEQLMVTNHEKPETSWLIGAIEKLGFPVVVSGVLLYLGLIVGRELIESHKHFLAAVTLSVQSQEKSMAEMSKVLASNDQHADIIVKNQAKIMTMQETIISILGNQTKIMQAHSISVPIEGVPASHTEKASGKE